MNNFAPDTEAAASLETCNANENTFNRQKLLCPPSCVLHLGDIPPDTTEEEVISLALPFGKVTNILMLKGKRQALLEMATEQAAVNMMDYYTLVTPSIRNQPVYIQYSNYRELKTDNLANQARTQATLQALNATYSGNQVVSSASGAGEGHCPDSNCVLRVIIDNISYPITLEILHQVFSDFGNVLKIITFTKNHQFQALIQYDDPRSAFSAKMNLNGQGIYTACCTLRIDFSKFAKLTIRYNNDKSRDFTCLDYSSGNDTAYMDQSVAAAYGTQDNTLPSYPGAAGFTPAMGYAQGHGTQDNTLPSYPGAAVFTPAMGYAQGHGPFVPPVPAVHGSLEVTRPVARKQMTHRRVAGTSVLLVSNLNPEAVTPHGLFILFGIYGDVHRVKIMFRKKEKALVQMADEHQAQLAISNLNGQRLYGRVIRARFSKYHTVQLLHQGQDDQGLTKDYSNSPLHRFKVPGSKNFRNIFPPSSTLHLSNIPPLVSVDDLKNLFESNGCTVKAFRFFQKDCKMALIQLDSVEEAVHAIIDLHNHDLGQNHNLRISFSKFKI